MALPVRQQLTYWGLATAGFLAVLWVLGDVILPFLVGGAIAYFLDPIADKLLVASLIVVLVAIKQIDGMVVIPAIVIVCREILVSGLREYLAEVKVPLPVSRRIILTAATPARSMAPRRQLQCSLVRLRCYWKPGQS